MSGMAGRFNPEMVESLNRNHWSICPGITGRFAPESVVDLGRNTQHVRDTLDDINEIALEEEPSYLDFLAYIVQEEVNGRENTQRQRRMKASRPEFIR